MGNTDSKAFTLPKPILTLLVTLLIIGLLVWEHFHGGVPKHHILQRKELPEISNWWGGLLLPVLTWFLLGRVQKRIDKQLLIGPEPKHYRFQIISYFITGLCLAILLVIAFINNYTPFLENVPYIFLLLSLFIPIYFSEFILGFILGMSYTFGVILPTAFVLILTILGFLIYKFIRPIFVKIANKLFPKKSNPLQ